MFQLLLIISNQFLQDLTPNDQTRCAILLKEMSHLVKEIIKNFSLTILMIVSQFVSPLGKCLKRIHVPRYRVPGFNMFD